LSQYRGDTHFKEPRDFVRRMTVLKHHDNREAFRKLSLFRHGKQLAEDTLTSPCLKQGSLQYLIDAFLDAGAHAVTGYIDHAHSISVN